jgi:serine/threonine protein kinase
MGKAVQHPPAASNANLLALPEGTELVGDYRIKRVLGAGGFGITYLADEIALGRDVTIKEYFPADFAARRGASDAVPRSQGCAEDYQWGLDRFIEEAQTLARFVHPNIVRLYRYFRANSTGYMVLHFEEGGSFKSWLKGLKRAPRQPELDRMVAPLLEALEMVHAGDFLHRDIAPDNIIIRRDGSPVLIDFGSARGEIASHSKTVSALVKPGYSPYEQYATTSRQQGPWTDIYALGATLYHAVSGKRPPDAPSRMVNDEYVSAREAALSSYRGTFLAAIDKALRLEVGERPQSIAEWRAALLSPEPKREGRLSLGRALQRLRTVEPAATLAKKAVPEPKAEPKTDNPSLVPAPPDAPQQKGQLLDFIEALKKHRPALAPRKAPGAARPAPGAAQAQIQAPSQAPPRPAPGEAQFGLGYGPRPEASSHGAAPGTAPRSASAAPSVARPAPAVLARRAPPRPRRMRRIGLPSRRWRSVLYKLAIGLGIAGLAVAYQEKMPHIEGRGAGVVASQTGDLSPAPSVRLAGHRGAVTGLAPGDQGRWMVSAGADATLKIWSALGALVRTIELDEGPVTALAVDERRALTGHKAGAIVLWDLERAEKLAAFQLGEAGVSALAFTGDANGFAATSPGGAVALFDIRTPPAPTATLDAPDGAQALAGARLAGLLVSAGQDRSIRLWRTDTRTLARTWRGPGEGLSALDIAPGGRNVASGGANGSLRLWSTASSRLQRQFRAHDGRVTALAFAPNDRVLATAGADGQVKLWDLRSGRPARVLRGHVGPVNVLAFSADGRRLVSGGQDGSIRIWQTAAAAAPPQ